MEYEVTCTMIHNATLIVDADSKEDAVKKAQEILNNDADNTNVDWEFGESTADYAKECTEDN